MLICAKLLTRASGGGMKLLQLLLSIVPEWVARRHAGKTVQMLLPKGVAHRHACKRVHMSLLAQASLKKLMRNMG